MKTKQFSVVPYHVHTTWFEATSVLSIYVHAIRCEPLASVSASVRYKKSYEQQVFGPDNETLQFYVPRSGGRVIIWGLYGLVWIEEHFHLDVR